MEKETDKREHHRFQVRIGVGAALNERKVGAIANISRGGLALNYIDLNGEDKNVHQGPSELNILHDDGFSLKNLPCQIIGVYKNPSHCSYSSLSINLCHIQFGRLTAEQKSQLEKFLDLYTDKPFTSQKKDITFQLLDY
jgi:hypothetical protein